MEYFFEKEQAQSRLRVAVGCVTATPTDSLDNMRRTRVVRTVRVCAQKGLVEEKKGRDEEVRLRKKKYNSLLRGFGGREF